MTRVLLAEDEPPLREILYEGLVDHGFEVKAAVDGADALRLYRTEGPFDAVLVDEEMPGLTGRGFLQTLRSEGVTVPAVILSGHLILDDAERAALGVGRVLRKPVSMREIVAALREAIAGRRGP